MPLDGEEDGEPQRNVRSRWADEEEDLEELQAIPNGKVRPGKELYYAPRCVVSSGLAIFVD